MPKTDPMSSHDLTLRIGKMFCEASKTDARKSVTMDEAIDKTDELIAQRDRAVLEQAAQLIALLKKALRHLANLSNKVTCSYRHNHSSRLIAFSDIEKLYEAQLEAESILSPIADKEGA